MFTGSIFARVYLTAGARQFMSGATFPIIESPTLLSARGTKYAPKIDDAISQLDQIRLHICGANWPARAAVANVLIRILTLRYCGVHAEKRCARLTLNHDAISFIVISRMFLLAQNDQTLQQGRSMAVNR